MRSTRALRVEGDDTDQIALIDMVCISIHALRVKGDYSLSATYGASVISIHALRVKGDFRLQVFESHATGISIHALRVKGDSAILRL